MMDQLPPNGNGDSFGGNNNNDNNNGNDRRSPRAKEQPHSGGQRRTQRGQSPESRDRESPPQPQLNENGEMDVFGIGANAGGDQGLVLAMFVMGVASWILHERCVC